MKFDNLVCETHDRVAVVTLNRPKALNALNDQTIDELNTALDLYEADPHIRAVVLTGSEKAFAAGADVTAMQSFGFIDVYANNFISRNWDRIARFRKPIIAAVAGYALGGGCELALACDFIIAADSAQFGQPEIRLGILPGAGGTQRLPRAVGKAKAMEMCLSGRTMDAEEAERSGLVSRTVPAAELLAEALAAAEMIARNSLPVIQMIKESVNRAFESSLAEGLLFERRTFHTAFALVDRKEGMTAFVEKRKPRFTDC